eukprot:CAMPEP_0168328256 /NCGR_PEP_ID=MMETSP0213-20121227/6377_1 /TAXON_ID=151035 /ORGANISM="Euplotes harpa, Strain FSP1.4" /LENGTH=183 /DNA_ID=CAMNT_0008331301 /DNA_START=442 /DNA_END=993 /DNA_ORIENTATION=-
MRSLSPLRNIFEYQEKNIFDIPEPKKVMPKITIEVCESKSKKRVMPSLYFSRKFQSQDYDEPSDAYSDASSNKSKRKVTKSKKKLSKCRRKNTSDSQIPVIVQGLTSILDGERKQSMNSSKNVLPETQYLKPKMAANEANLNVNVSSRRRKNLSISYKPSYMLEMIKNLEELSTEMESADNLL